MSVAKIIEISCESPNSFEDAIKSGIARASKTVSVAPKTGVRG